ncbi:hypothetical protein GCK32_022246, partial [Trichostrongylus colubriformis]
SSHKGSSESSGENSGFTYLPDHTIAPSEESLDGKVQRNIRTRRTVPVVTTGGVAGPVVDPAQTGHIRTTDVVDQPTVNVPVGTVQTGPVVPV